MSSPGYEALHLRVRKLRGRPARCELCETADPAKRYEWANLTGRYADPGDYARLCKLCHCCFDGARRMAARGRPVYGALTGRELLGHLAAQRRAAREAGIASVARTIKATASCR